MKVWLVVLYSDRSEGVVEEIFVCESERRAHAEKDSFSSLAACAHLVAEVEEKEVLS